MLSQESRTQIDREIAKYPADQKQSAVMAALAIVQMEQGWLSTETIEDVAVHLSMAPVAVYEVASFYNMYDLAPVGKYKITVCTNLPCALSGGMHAADYLKQKLGVGFNETTADGRFTLQTVECLGNCDRAPCLMIDDDDHERVTVARLDEILDRRT